MSDITARRASSISSLEHAPQRNTSSADSLHRQGPTADLFATIDRNGDGHIDRDEWNAAVAQADKREMARDGEGPEAKRSRADEVTAETGDGGDSAVLALRDALDAYCAGMCDELSSVSSTFTMLKLRHSHGGGDGAGAAAAPAAVCIAQSPAASQHAIHTRITVVHAELPTSGEGTCLPKASGFRDVS